MDITAVNWMKNCADLRIYKKCDGTVAVYLDAVYVGIAVNGISASAWVLKKDYAENFAGKPGDDATVRLRWEKTVTPINGKIPAQLSINGTKMRIYIVPKNMTGLINS